MKMKSITRRTGSALHIYLGGVLVLGALAVSLLSSLSTWAGGFKSPEECLAYSGDAHLNCLYAYIEIQKDTISKLEKNIRGQQLTTQELQSRIKQKDVRAKALERKIKDSNSQSRGEPYQFIRPYGGYSYRFGSPYYYDPYFGPPFGNSYGLYYPWW